MKKVGFKSNLLKDNDWFVEGYYYVADDSSLLFSSNGGGYQLLLSKNWRYSLDVDSESGRCYGFFTILNALDYEQTNLTIPVAEKGSLYYSCCELEAGSGGYYLPFKDKCYIDMNNCIICVGNRDACGETIEFATNTFAVVSDDQLQAVYIKIPIESLSCFKNK